MITYRPSEDASIRLSSSAAHREQTHALRRSSAGIRLSTASGIRAVMHQQSPGGSPAVTAHPFGCPHRGQREGSTSESRSGDAGRPAVPRLGTIGSPADWDGFSV